MGVMGGGRVFVAGATGYSGSALIMHLRERGVAVTAHVRPDSSSLEQWRGEFGAVGATVDTTPWNAAAMRATLERVQPVVVFSLLGTTRKRARRASRSGGRSDYETVDVGLSVLLLDATTAAAPAARFVYLSSIGTSANARGEYLRARWRVEQAVRTSGIEWTIARPSFITGPDRPESRPLERIGAAATDFSARVATMLGWRRFGERYASMSATDLARALAAAADREECVNRVLEAEELRRLA